MRTKRWCEIGFGCLLMLLAACSPRQAPPVVTATPPPPPTEVVATEVPSPTELMRATLPDTWTPIFSWTPSITPTPSNTYTPSMTFTASKTFTPTPTWTVSNTPTPNATNRALLSGTLTPECEQFGPDRAQYQNQFSIGSAPVAIWTPVDLAAAYLVRLYDTSLVTLLSETTTETQYTFPAELFHFNEIYAWDVSPLDADGVQICPSRGTSLFPTP